MPIWVFDFFPSQDGVSHIYNAHVLKEYHKHENYIIRDVWKLNLTVFPNWLYWDVVCFSANYSGKDSADIDDCEYSNFVFVFLECCPQGKLVGILLVRLYFFL